MPPPDNLSICFPIIRNGIRQSNVRSVPVDKKGGVRLEKRVSIFQQSRVDKEKSMPISERKKEIKRRRHRKKVYASLAKKVGKMNPTEKSEVAIKLRSMTPGAEEIIERMGLEAE